MPDAVPPVQLFLGPEEGQKAEAIEKTAAALASRNGEPPEIHRFYAFESKWQDILSVLQNKSLFSRHRLVIVSSVEAIKRKEEITACVEYIKSPAPDATLLLVTPGLSREVDKSIIAAVPKDRQKVFWEMFDNQKSGWIINFFRQRKITIEQVAVDYLLEMVENNTRDLRAECERLSMFFGAGSALDLEKVEHYIYHSKEENVFTLFDQLSEKSLLASEEILEKLLLSRQADATQLVSGLMWQFKRLAGFKKLLEQNYEPSEACQKSGLTTKKAQHTYLEGSRSYTSQELETIVLLLTEFDSRFRSIKADLHPLLLHLMLYYIIARGGSGTWKYS
jgi:DNA polymerase-3 subunit delta